jgi:hypothetical protein
LENTVLQTSETKTTCEGIEIYAEAAVYIRSAEMFKNILANSKFYMSRRDV